MDPYATLGKQNKFYGNQWNDTAANSGFGAPKQLVPQTQPAAPVATPGVVQQPQQSYAPVWFNNQMTPQTSVNASSPAYSQRTTGTVADIVNTIGQYLKPQEAFTNVLDYNTYAAPQQEVFNLWANQMYRPEFERQTLNPWMENYANQAAAAGAQRLGGGAQRYEREKYSTEQPYYQGLEQMRNQYEDMIRQGYNTRMERYYTSPTAFTNI